MQKLRNFLLNSFLLYTKKYHDYFLTFDIIFTVVIKDTYTKIYVSQFHNKGKIKGGNKLPFIWFYNHPVVFGFENISNATRQNACIIQYLKNKYFTFSVIFLCFE